MGNRFFRSAIQAAISAADDSVEVWPLNSNCSLRKSHKHNRRGKKEFN